MKVLPAFAGTLWMRRLVRGVLVVIGLIAIFALVGVFVVPPIAKAKLEAAASEALGRSAKLNALEFNPFTLRARLIGFALADREPGRTLLSFDTLDVDFSAASFLHRAPILDAVRLVRPRVELVRNDDGSYNIQDLIDRVLDRPAGPVPRFSVNNIEINDGSVAFDDRPKQRKVNLTGFGVGIPFLSSFDYDAQIRVTPHLEGAVDGAHFALGADATTPFAPTKAATLDIDVDGLALPEYAPYLPLPDGLKLKEGALTTRIKLAFISNQGSPNTLTLGGSARIDRLAMMRGDGSALAGARMIEVAIAKMDLLQRSIALDRLVAEAPELDLRRDPDGRLEYEGLLADKSTAKTAAGTPAPVSTQRDPGWTVTIGDGRIADGTVRVADRSVSPSFEAVLSKVRVQSRQIASNAAGGTLDASFDTDTGAHFDGHGDLDLPRRAARGHFSLTGFHLAKLYPYYADALNLEVRKGTIDLAADFDLDAAASPLQLKLAQGAATFRDVDMALSGEADPLWRFAKADFNDVALDLAGRRLAVGSVEASKAAFTVIRARDGAFSFARLVRTSERTGGASAASSSAETGWIYAVQKVTLDNAAASFEDRGTDPPVKLKIADARISASPLSNARGAKGALEIVAKIDRNGRLRVIGPMTTSPFSADWRIDASSINLVPLRPYFESRTNVILTSGALTAKGRATFGVGASGDMRGGYAGDLTVTDFASLDRPGSQELVRWKTLRLTGVDAASEPSKLGLGAIALDGFYARVIVNPDATLNLSQLLAGENSSPPSAEPSPAPANAATGVATKALPPPSPERADLPITIERIELSDGEVQFSDFFIQPNYSAHLTKVSGSVSKLSARQAGQVAIAGSVEGTAPVDISGSINALAREWALDITAKATGVDLPPLTPYSQKYAGYGIEKGKLSMEVHYKIDNRKLAATNKLMLDQLTFGQHVDSPTATKLPVLLAVALLKDRNGVIHLDLPIQGTLDDPKFSVWGVIVQIIVNLIGKAATAPFALLGALAGGHGEELAFIEFAPGRANLNDAADTKLRSLAKALVDRPALKLDIAGRAVPDLDRDGLRRAALDRAVRLQKQKALAARGDSAPPLDTIQIDDKEYPRYLTAVYDATDLKTKPRNVIGIAKTIPPAEMEALLLASYNADDEALHALANRRAQAAKEWLVGEGGVPAERVFVVAARLGTDGVKDGGAPTRADFAIR